MNKKLKRLISYYKPYKETFILDIILSIISSMVAISIPIICHYITSKAIYLNKYEATKTVFCLAILIISLYVIFYTCKRYTEYKGKLFASKIEIDIENELFIHFQNQDFGFYDEQKVGKLMSHITNDAYNLTNVIKCTPEIVLGAFIRFLSVFTFLFFYNKIFGLILFSVYILMFIFMRNNLPRVQSASRLSREIFSNITSDLEETLSGIKTVKSFTNESLEVEKFTNDNNAYLKARSEMYKIQSVFDAGLLSFVIGLSPIITVIGSFFIISNLITITDVLAFILYIGVLESPLWDIVRLNEFVREGIVGFNRIIDFLEIEPKIINSSNAVSLKHINGTIEFNDVFFKFDKANKSIFEGLDLKINKGEYVALVGSSGVGKSTFCNLIPRFYDVFSGEILIDGIDVKKIKLSDLRQGIGFVHQDTFLFSGTIMKNILYGNPKANEYEVIQSAKNAYAHDFIMSFPDGYNTHIGPRGLKLSGGQKQRLAIARVFLKNPSILIFDEATSSLDSESEKYVQKSMEKLTMGRTTIVIAHRLSTIKNAKRILVMANGKIVEEGTHSELLSKNGAYADFYSLL